MEQLPFIQRFIDEYVYSGCNPDRFLERLNVMTRFVLATLAVFSMMALPFAAPADAGGRYHRHSESGSHSKSGYYRGKSEVRGYVKRRGGYSYSKEDTINTYGDSRGRFGAANSLRDPSMDTQTRSGPFDHGFFFNTPKGSFGGDAPYMN